MNNDQLLHDAILIETKSEDLISRHVKWVRQKKMLNVHAWLDCT